MADRAAFTRTYSPSVLNTAMPIGAASKAMSKYRWASFATSSRSNSTSRHNVPPGSPGTGRALSSHVTGTPLGRSVGR